MVEHVDVPGEERTPLTHALNDLFEQEFGAEGAFDAVTIENGRSSVNLKFVEAIGFASTSCGGVGFRGSVLRTVFQFDYITEARLLFEGSCKSFGEFSQAGKCITFNRSDL